MYSDAHLASGIVFVHIPLDMNPYLEVGSMAARRKRLWFGFLEAGEKSSPVIRDRSLNTGQASTIYLFNMKKGRIIEYRRDIVEPRLRKLNQDELGLRAELESAYGLVRPAFTPRADLLSAPRPRRRRREPNLELPDLERDELMPFLDADDTEMETEIELS
jgi:hypothetical protein